MAVELSYVLITPYSLKKSRTGGIVSRLVSRSGLELAAAQMITLDYATAEKFADSILAHPGQNADEATLFHDYVMDNFVPNKDGKGLRLMLLLFRGENACAKLSEVIGPVAPVHDKRMEGSGETVRDTFADLVYSRDGSVQYFEPAVFSPSDLEGNDERLKILADYLDGKPNIVENYAAATGSRERTLVIIKPDNWTRPSTKPGNVIDMFSRTGLNIVGCKVFHMSVAEGLEFYGAVQGALRKKLAPVIAWKAREKLESEFGIKMRDEDLDVLTQSVGFTYADDQFNKIVEFMSGTRPDSCPKEELELPGKAMCMPVIYEGADAVAKIRNVLGPTDPTKAPAGTIRCEFGKDVMVNTAHASDSHESFVRETGILKIEENNLVSIIRKYLQQ